MKPMVDGENPSCGAAQRDQRALQAVAAEQDAGGDEKRDQRADGGHRLSAFLSDGQPSLGHADADCQRQWRRALVQTARLP